MLNMEGFSKNEQNKTSNDHEEEMINIQDNNEVAKYMESLPQITYLNGLRKLVNYQGFWYIDIFLKDILAFQKHFQAHDSDLIIASFPKTGSTWLKTLLFAIVNRKTPNLSLLLQNHPHELVYLLEHEIYGHAFDYPQPHHLEQLPEPRFFHTHLPYQSLPESIKTSRCRILSLTRNPLDTFVSLYYFLFEYMKKVVREERAKCLLPTIEDFMEESCYQGKCPSGPFFDHVLGYWEKSLELPHKIMFLMYEDLKDDPMIQVKRVAEFIGFPFSTQEESDGIVQEIVKICNFKNLKELDVNKNGVINTFFEKKSYFRKGEVGDWTNHFPPHMLERLNKFMDEKIGGNGLSFRFNSH